jgi:uncharacterized membrane-anchored protein YjiN (DUF445 family)
MRVVATSLLVAAAVVFLLTREMDGGWGYVNAAAEAAMVGAIADWFAVTALFRHPLGLPIPHTAIIPRRKASLGASLQEFVTENFLRADVVKERLESAELTRRTGVWLADGDHAERLVREGSKITAHALTRVKQEDVAALVRDAIVPRLVDEPLAPVAGRLLGDVLAERAHVGMVDLVLDELHAWLVENADEVMAIVGERAPWWTPQWVDERVGARLHLEAVSWVQEIREQPEHRARRALDGWLTRLVQDLQDDEETQERFERLKARMLNQPQVTTTGVAIWDALRRALVETLQDEDGMLRRRALQEVRDIATRLQEDVALQERGDRLVADAGAYLVDHYGSDVATIISSTVDRWDGVETAKKVELHVGRDLQFIRINGTVVGGLAGLVIHTVSHLV